MGVAPSSEDRGDGDVTSSGLSADRTMKELAARSRLVMTPYPKPKSRVQYLLDPDGVPLAALTQVQEGMWVK